MFDLKKAKIYKVLKWEKFFKLVVIFKKIFFVLLIVFLTLFLYGFLPENFSQETNRTLFGLCLIFLFFFSGLQFKESFFNQKMKVPVLPSGQDRDVWSEDEKNIAEFLSFKSAKAVLKSNKNQTKLLYFLLKDNPELAFVFSRLLLNLNNFKENLKKVIKTQDKENQEKFQEIFPEALKTAQENGRQRIKIGDILSVLAEKEPFFKKILIENKLNSQDIKNLTCWLEKIKDDAKKRKRFWDYENLAKKGSLAKNWTSGYTIVLDKYSYDITESIRKKDLIFVGHKQEIETMERTLALGEINNILLVGEPGTGKRSMVYALAQKIVLGKSLEGLNYKRVVELDLPALLAQIESKEKLESILDRIFQETVSAGNVIMLISDFHNYVGQEERPGLIDISGVIAPYLRFSQFRVIALTNYQGLHRHIERNPSVLSLFEKTEVVGISGKQTLGLLEHLTPSLEKKHKIFISYPVLRQIISLTEQYLPSLYFPEKAVDILDEVAVYAAGLKKEKIVRSEHVAKIITEKTEIPVGEIDLKEKEILLNLEELIHKRIINQKEAVREVSTALRRSRSEITSRKGPMGAFLFLGPTGVGKTETSKALAENYFGGEEKMIRLDMSEFQDTKDIPRLIGSEKEVGLLTSPVKESPFSLILLDEIEKADSNILNLFLQVLDEGRLTDGFGRKINFKNTIIIATSNAGYKIILKALKENKEWPGVKTGLLDYLFENRIFRPEFINRFDAVVVFSPLSKENLLDIAGLMLSEIKKNLLKKGVELVITEDLKEKIVDLGYSPTFGAREMRRVIQAKVENILAEALLSGRLSRGSKIAIDLDQSKILFNP